MSDINDTISHRFTELSPDGGSALLFLDFLRNLSDIRKLMDIAFFLVILYSFPYDLDEIRLITDSHNIQTGTSLVATVDAHGLQAEKHLRKAALLAVIDHSVQFNVVSLNGEDAVFILKLFLIDGVTDAAQIQILAKKVCQQDGCCGH